MNTQGSKRNASPGMTDTGGPAGWPALDGGTVALFPGMAAAFPGMGRPLNGLGAAERTFAAFSGASGADVSGAACTAAAEALFRDRTWELAVVATEAAALAAWNASGGRVAASLGFSIGAYAALMSAGAVTVEQVVAMVDIVLDASRRLPDRFAMVAVSGSSPVEVSRFLRRGEAELAAVTQPGQLLLAGREDAMRELAERIAPTVLAVRFLPVHWPLHTSLMLLVSRELEDRRRQVGPLRRLRHPVYSAIDGGRIETPEGGWRLLVDHLHRPQRFDLAFEAVRSDGLSDFVEFGPAGTLSRAVRWLTRGELAVAAFPGAAPRPPRVAGRR
jgi:acyl transferase domain-containing protein